MKSCPDPSRELLGTAVYHHMDRLIGNTDHQGNTNLNLEKISFVFTFSSHQRFSVSIFKSQPLNIKYMESCCVAWYAALTGWLFHFMPSMQLQDYFNS